MSIRPILLVICTILVVGMAYGDNQNGTVVDLVITTHNPTCTVIFMDGRDGVVLQTELRPHPYFGSYTVDEIKNGVNMTYALPAHQADKLLPAISERREVSNVASYSTSDPPILLANAAGPNSPGASIFDYKCGSRLQEGLYRAVYDAILHASRLSDVSGASGPTASEETVWTEITTIGSNAKVLAFLKEHGITAQFVYEPTSTSLGSMDAHVPISLLAKLAEIDQVVRVEEVYVIKPDPDFNTLDTLEGVEIVGVTPQAPEGTGTTSTGNLPVFIIYGMAGLAAVGGGLFFVFSNRALKNEKEGQQGIDPSRLVGYQTNRGEAQLRDQSAYQQTRSYDHLDTLETPPRAPDPAPSTAPPTAEPQVEATCSCATSAESGMECDCQMQGSCLCDATCQCSGNVCISHVSMM